LEWEVELIKNMELDEKIFIPAFTTVSSLLFYSIYIGNEKQREFGDLDAIKVKSENLLSHFQIGNYPFGVGGICWVGKSKIGTKWKRLNVKELISFCDGISKVCLQKMLL
jgi:hypothetical protein